MFRSVRDLVTGDLRKELQQRVDDLLNATADTMDTVDKLRESIDRLTAQLASGRVDPATVSELKSLTASWKSTTERLYQSSQVVHDTVEDLANRLSQM